MTLSQFAARVWRLSVRLSNWANKHRRKYPDTARIAYYLSDSLAMESRLYWYLSGGLVAHSKPPEVSRVCYSSS